jgi:hypothetical protein
MADLPSEFIHDSDPLAAPEHWLARQLREVTTRDSGDFMRFFMDQYK